MCISLHRVWEGEEGRKTRERKKERQAKRKKEK